MNTGPTVSSSLVNKIIERVESIETRLNDRLLLCRGPEVTTKIAAASGDGSPNLGMLKADICASICGDKVNEISVNSVGFSLFGKDRNLLKIECTDSNTKDFILKQARSRKPRGIYVVEYLPSHKLQVFNKALELKRKYPGKIKAVYTRKGEIFCRSDPDDRVLKIQSVEDVNTAVEIEVSNSRSNNDAEDQL